MSNTHGKETDVSDPLYQGNGNIAINPKTTANFFSTIFFWWINKTLKLGNKQPLQDDDLFPLLEEDNTQRLVECIATEWKEEVEVSHEKGTKPQLWKAVKRVIPAKAYVKLVVLSLLSSASFVGVLVLIWFFLRSLGDMSYIEYVASSRYILGIGILCLVRALTVHHAENFCEVWGMRLKVATTGLVYRKVNSLTSVVFIYEMCKILHKCIRIHITEYRHSTHFIKHFIKHFHKLESAFCYTYPSSSKIWRRKRKIRKNKFMYYQIIWPRCIVCLVPIFILSLLCSDEGITLETSAK